MTQDELDGALAGERVVRPHKFSVDEYVVPANEWDKKDERIAELEKQLAAMTAERDKCLNEHEVAGQNAPRWRS